MEDLASWVALVGKASPLLLDKRWPWPMMWNGSDWLSLIPHQSEPSSSPGAQSTTVTLSDISYFTLTTMTTAGYCNSDLIPMLLGISHFTPATGTTVAYLSPGASLARSQPSMILHLTFCFQSQTSVPVREVVCPLCSEAQGRVSAFECHTSCHRPISNIQP